jgi:hypothetical protein
MYFDAEMILIYAIASLSGVVFYLIASGDARKDSPAEPQCNLCDSRH